MEKMLNASKLRDDSKLGARLSEEAIENHIRYTQEYLTLLATNVQQIHAEEALNAISALISFKDYFLAEEEWNKLVIQLLQIVREGMYHASFHQFAIFSGISHVAYVARCLAQRVSGLEHFVHSIDQILVENISQFLKTMPTDDIDTLGTYEVIRGMSGPLRYLLDFSDELTNTIKKELISALIRRSKPKLIAGHKIIGWHYYPSKAESAFMVEKAPNGVINYGLSHGMAGPLVVLSLAYKDGIRVDGLEEAIDGILSEYLKGVYYIKDIAYWPNRIKLEQYIGQESIEREARQMSWCYGSVGILRSLYLAGVYTARAEIKKFAYEHLVRIASMKIDDYMLELPIVCHGFAGTAAIFDLMYRDTKEEVFLSRAIEMIEMYSKISIKQHLEMGEFLAQLRHLPSRAFLHDYLEGYSGILQTTQSIINRVPNGNEKRLLII